MRRVTLLRLAVIAAAITLFSGACEAGNAAVSWGVGGSPSDPAIRSATLHDMETRTAQSVARSKTWNQSITSCGVCTYYQINGSNNSISGNSITASNSGTITSNGTYNNDYHWDFW